MLAHEFNWFKYEQAEAWLEFHFRRRTTKHIVTENREFILDDNGEPLLEEREVTEQFTVLVVEYDPEIDPTKPNDAEEKSLFAYCDELLRELDDEIDEVILRKSSSG